MTCHAGVHPFQMPQTLQTTFTTIYTISSIIAALGNTFCLIVLWQPSQRSKSNKILTSLALSDCLVGYVCFPLAVWLLLNDTKETSTTGKTVVIEGLFVLLTEWMFHTSCCSIVFTAYERYLTITRNARRGTILTDRKILWVVVFYWAFNLVLSIIFSINTHTLVFGNGVLTGASNFIICYSYYRIWKEVKESSQRVSRMQQPPTNRPNTGGNTVKKIISLITVYLLGVIPLSACAVMLLTRDFSKQQGVHFKATSYVNVIGNFCGLSVSSLNPFVYLWRDAEFRKATKRLLGLNTDNSGNSVRPYSGNKNQAELQVISIPATITKESENQLPVNIKELDSMNNDEQAFIESPFTINVPTLQTDNDQSQASSSKGNSHEIFLKTLRIDVASTQ